MNFLLKLFFQLLLLFIFKLVHRHSLKYLDIFSKGILFHLYCSLWWWRYLVHWWTGRGNLICCGVYRWGRGIQGWGSLTYFLLMTPLFCVSLMLMRCCIWDVFYYTFKWCWVWKLIWERRKLLELHIRGMKGGWHGCWVARLLLYQLSTLRFHWELNIKMLIHGSPWMTYLKGGWWGETSLTFLKGLDSLWSRVPL